MRIYPTSMRGKLTLIAVSIMGLLFVVLGGIVQLVGRAEIMGGVDAELQKRANEIIQVHNSMRNEGPPPPRPEDQRGPDQGENRHPDDQQGPGDRRGEDGQQGQGPNNDRRGRGPGNRFGGFQRAVARIGDPLLNIGPRFILISNGPFFAPPDMMVPYDASVIRQADRQGIVYSTVMLGNEKVRVITKRSVDEHGVRWLVQFPYPLGDIDKAIKKLNQTLVLLLPLGLLLTAGACLLLMNRIMKPIREISQTADSFTADNMSGRLTVPGGDEFGQLANTINGMLDRVESAFSSQRIALEKVESVLKQQRRFTADASHELKTPLAVIKANTGLMIHSMKLDEDATQTVEAIDLAATRMNRLVQDLMVLSRTEAGQSKIKPSPVHLGEIVASAVRSVNRPNAPVIELIGAREGLIVTGLVADLERVFVNLVDNACRHTAPDGKVRVEIRQLVDRISVEVTDTGEGIAPEHLEHIFDRFYRVDSSRSSESGGTGLGLAICKSIVEAHHGSITVASELKKGTTFIVTLPLDPTS